jgi:hypothetical protein
MKPGKTRSLVFFILLFAVAALALDASYAQGRGSGGQQKQQMPQGQQGQGQMQKDMHQKGQMSQQKLMHQQMPDQAMYGHQMMTAEERERYRQQLNSAQSDREWSRMRAEHQREMQSRAKAQGRPIDPPVFGEHMMSAEERNRYMQRMQAATTDAEKARIREEHQQSMMQRAEELGIGEMLQEQ